MFFFFVSCVARSLAMILLYFLRCCEPMLIVLWLGLLWCVVFNGVLGFAFGSGQWSSCFVFVLLRWGEPLL